MIKAVSAAILIAALAAPAASAAPQSTSRAPQFDTAPTCRGAGSASPNSAQNDRDVCMQKEKNARAELDKQWASFPTPDRSRCILSTGAGGIPSYVELLTCLEIAKQARELAQGKPGQVAPSTTGTAPRTAD